MVVVVAVLVVVDLPLDSDAVATRFTFMEIPWWDACELCCCTVAQFDGIYFQVSIDIDGENKWKPCFTVEGVRLPTGYYFGASAATGDLSGAWASIVYQIAVYHRVSCNTDGVESLQQCMLACQYLPSDWVESPLWGHLNVVRRLPPQSPGGRECLCVFFLFGLSMFLCVPPGPTQYIFHS